MRKGIVLSAALHLGVIGATMVAWPGALRPSEETPSVIPINLVTIAEVTDMAPTVSREPPPAPRELEPLPVVPVIEPMAEVQLSRVEAPPPEPAPAPAAEPDARAPPRQPPRPLAKPPPAQRQPQFDVDSVIALLDDRQARAPAAPQAPVAEQTVRGIGAQNAMTMDLIDALRTQMRPCWNAPMGAPNPEELIVRVRIFLAPNGGLAQPPQLTAESRAAAAANPYLRTAGEAALRAVNICAPYRGLPQDRYAQWREIDMIFDPSQMAGR